MTTIHIVQQHDCDIDYTHVHAVAAFTQREHAAVYIIEAQEYDARVTELVASVNAFLEGWRQANPEPDYPVRGNNFPDDYWVVKREQTMDAYYEAYDQYDEQRVNAIKGYLKSIDSVDDAQIDYVLGYIDAGNNVTSYYDIVEVELDEGDAT